MALRIKTQNDLINLISELRQYFNKDEITRQEFLSFQDIKPNVYVPLGPFNEICLDRNQRGIYNLNLFVPEFDQTEVSQVVTEIVTPETDEEIITRITNRFGSINKLARGAIAGHVRSLIIAGSAGVGKSHSVLEMVNEIPEERRSVLGGRVTATGIFRALYKHRFENHVVVFDDADSVFETETTMNLLKRACDSSDDRFITVDNGKKYFDENGDEIPSTFQFNGSVIFITNYDFRALANKNDKMSSHFEAMLSRSHYITMFLKSAREYMVHIGNIVRTTTIMSDYEERTRDEVLQFIEMNKSKMTELSLRMVKKVASLTLIDPSEWRMLAQDCCMKE